MRLNPEERVNRIGKWFIDGLIIDDGRIEPFKLSMMKVLAFHTWTKANFVPTKISKTHFWFTTDWNYDSTKPRKRNTGWVDGTA